MFGFGQKKDSSKSKNGMLTRLRQGLAKTRNMMLSDIEDIFRRKQEIDADLLDEIETRLIMADLGEKVFYGG